MESEIEKKKTWEEFHKSPKSKDYYSVEQSCRQNNICPLHKHLKKACKIILLNSINKKLALDIARLASLFDLPLYT